MFHRLVDLSTKAWSYSLQMLEHPACMPRILWHIAANQVHLGELLKLQHYSPWLPELGIETIIDIGAHSGEFASAAAVTFPKAQIYSFEPQPTSFQRLLSRMEKHRSFRAFKVALGDTRGEIDFHQHSFSKASSILPMAETHRSLFPWTAAAQSTTVHLARLDDYLNTLTLAPEVLLKIDVQGYEGNVLKGAQVALDLITVILIEISFTTLYEGQASFDEVYSLLKLKGFAFHGCLDLLTSPIDNRIIQSDIVFIKQDRVG